MIDKNKIISLFATSCLAISSAMASGGLPDGVDNSKSKYFPPIINQQGGSCAQASYIGYMFTYEMNRLLDRDASASPANRFSYFYTWNFVNDGYDQGSFGPDGIKLALGNGIITEQDFPENAAYKFKWASGYEKYLNAIHYRASAVEFIEVKNLEGLNKVRRYLYDHNEESRSGGIVTFSSKAQNWIFDNNYSGPSATGYSCLLTKLATEGSHAMTIVGYDDLVDFNAPDGTVSKGAFIVCNSWGQDYHDRGRFYLPYWFWLQSGRDTAQLGTDVVTVKPSYKAPSIVFRVSMDCDSRNDIGIRCGFSDRLNDKYPATAYDVSIFDYQGGDHPMQGMGMSDNIEFALDFSSALPKINTDKPAYFLIISRNKRGSKAARVAKLNMLQVYDYRTMPAKVHTYDIMADSRNISGKGAELASGENVFRILTADAPKISCNTVDWINPQTSNIYSSTYIVRTAKGKYAKMRVMKYDKSEGQMRIKYVYAPSGGKKLK